MNKIHLLLILLVSLNSYTQKQELNSTALYTASLYEELGNKSENKASINDLNAVLRNSTVNFKLVFNKDESYYFVQDKLTETKDFRQEMAKILFGSTSSSYVERSKNELFHRIEAYGEFFIIPIKDWQWNLEKESKKIGQYVCYKATTNYKVRNSKGEFLKNVVAWYAPELNYPFGPKGFHGLPGLIIELYDSNYRYILKELNFKNTTEKVNKPKRGKKLTQEEFDDIGLKIDNEYGRQ